VIKVELQEIFMPKITITMDGAVIREVEITQTRTALGRRPYNDVVIENLAVSGEHAALHMVDSEVTIEDLNSTNGTFVNGKVVKKQVLHFGDTIEIGKYKVLYAAVEGDSVPAVPVRSGVDAQAANQPQVTGAVRVLSGPATGRELPLSKVVTTVGKPGVSIAAITRRHHYFSAHYVEGPERPLLNGVILTPEPVTLRHGDMMDLAGTRMEFLQSS
jgi:pSer/pThr/pTyr-binding forkhead associated (FHA) protein